MKKSIVKFTMVYWMLSLLVGCKKQTGDWQFVYENDASGQPVKGDVKELIYSIKKGYPIQIGWEMGHPGNGQQVYHTTKVKFITIMKDSMVFAQIDPIIAQLPNLEENTISFYDSVRWTVLASTNGVNETLLYDVKDTYRTIERKKQKWGTKWFVLSSSK